MIEFQKFDSEGLLLIMPKDFSDERGCFLETFHLKKYREIGIYGNFVQDNESVSYKSVMRGLHFQSPPFAQGKLIRVICGSLYDVAVDLRKNSPTFGKWYSVILSEKNRHQFWIPEGFAHGFLTLEDNTIVNYKCTAFYNASSEKTIMWNDPDLNISWPETPSIVSPKDTKGELFRNFTTPF